MQSKRDELVPVAEVVSGLGGPVAAIRDTSPQALHHFTLADQVDQLVSASEAEPDLGFMARLLALCVVAAAPGTASVQATERPVQVDLESDRRVQATLRHPAPFADGLALD